MSESTTNGTAQVASGDVEMKEEAHTGIEFSVNTFPQAADPTDPQPPPSNTEHLSSTQPALTPQPDPAASTTTAAQMPPTQATPSRGSAPPQNPGKLVPHGGPTRQYLNMNVTPHLLEAMKHLAVYEPEKPLAWLSEFLAEKSREVEGA